MTNLFARFVKDESGATAIEYALIAAGIAIAIITAVNSVGTSLTSTFTNIKTKLDANNAAAPAAGG
jgi:pilus assembly protein Flp/PilA